MIKRILIAVTVISAGFLNTLHAQLLIARNNNATQLAQSLAGTGITISNAAYTGSDSSIGVFSGGLSVGFGLDAGIVMSTGTVDSISGPSSVFADTWLNTLGDADLDTIAGLTNDATVLEFDLVPQGTTLNFRYIFGSEEYPDYTCSSFNDVFAFFISGANPGGSAYNKTNIALIPGTNLPVSINSINSGQPSLGYSSSDCISTSYSAYYVDNNFGPYIAYNGYTTVLGAALAVIPGSIYHFKLAIADATDYALDSGVFIEASSFVSPPVSNAIYDTICNGSSYTRPTGIVVTTAGTYVDTLPSSTGSDSIITTYLTVATSVSVTVNPTICSGQSYILPDGSSVNTAGTYVDTLQTQTGCDSIITTMLTTAAAINTSFSDTICTGKSYTLPDGNTATTTGAYVSHFQTQGGCDSLVTVNLYVGDLGVTVDAHDIICNGGGNGVINTTLAGGSAPFTFTLMESGTTLSSNSTGSFQNLSAGSYQVIVSDNFGCGGSDTGTIIEPELFQLQTPVTVGISCIGKKDGTITPSATGGVTPYSFSASQDGANFDYTVDGVIHDLAPGTYTVYANDNHGCSLTTLAVVPDAVPDIYISSADSTRCNGYSDGAIHVIGTTAQNGPFQYSLDGGAAQFSGDFFNVSAGYHVVTAYGRGGTGCATQIPLIVPEPPAIDVEVVPDTIILAVGETKEVQVYYTNAPNATFNWSTSFGLSCIDCSKPIVSTYSTTDYVVTVSSLNGTTTCLDSTKLHVKVLPVKPPFVPNTFSPNGDGNNDVFEIYGENIRQVGLTIFNRWGELVFKTDNAYEGWDGTYKGQLQLPQVFTYYANITFLDNTKTEKKGSVTLIR